MPYVGGIVCLVCCLGLAIVYYTLHYNRLGTAKLYRLARVVATTGIYPQEALLNIRYSRSEQLLHHLALNTAAVKTLCHDIERSFYLSRAKSLATRDRETDTSVIVCGLARSGTTVLLQILEKHAGFACLTYRDMPFVLAPNLWQKLSGKYKHSGVVQERAHGDGLTVHVDSPESFEEVFWQLITPYQKNQHGLHIPAPSEFALKQYQEYQLLIRLARGAAKQPLPRYLAKNNNHLARLACLARLPKTDIVVVFREPAAVALSLSRQHQRFLAHHRASPFDRRYMNWLAHHEFGADHYPFSAWNPSNTSQLDASSADYWLQYWINCHEWLLSVVNISKVILVSHQALCRSPENMLTGLAEKLNCPATLKAGAQMYRPEPQPTQNLPFSTHLLAKAQNLYSALVQHPATLTDEL